MGLLWQVLQHFQLVTSLLLYRVVSSIDYAVLMVVIERKIGYG